MTAADDTETAVTIALACLATATPRSPLPLGPGGSSGGVVSCHAAGSGTLLCPFNFVVAPAWPGMDRHAMGSLPDGISIRCEPAEGELGTCGSCMAAQPFRYLPIE